MRKEITICDICKKEIPPRTCCELSIITNKDLAEKLGLSKWASRRRSRHRRLHLYYIDVCKKECLIKLLEMLKLENVQTTG
ncbi:hypothetical protein ES708_11371 [subsurface metagenome]